MNCDPTFLSLRTQNPNAETANISLVTLLAAHIVVAQQIEKIIVPKGVVYNYTDSLTEADARRLIQTSISDTSDYALVDRVLFVGPMLWKRFRTIKEINNIKNGNTTLMVDGKELSAKMTQDVEDSKKVWRQFRKEVNGSSFTLRKATSKELIYYWSVISWDIDEPLIIVETSSTRYILNMSPKTLKLIWLDQAP